MNVSRGSRVYALLEREPCPATVLDRAPDGWWIAFENRTDPTNGRPIVEQRSSRHLYPSAKAAAGALAGKQ